MTKGDKARKWAADVYALSLDCLMAHTLRAAEQYIERTTGLPHRIKIKKSAYLGRRALAFIDVPIGGSLILYNTDIGFEDQRKAIAHEVCHILFEKDNGAVRGNNRIFDPETESACGIFEKDLCKKHSDFYKNEANVKRLIFRSLDDYS